MSAMSTSGANSARRTYNPTTARSVAAMTTQQDWRPRYVQLAEDLRDAISRGELRPGDPLPSEPELATRSGMSRTSVRNAIRQLREWGLVRAEQGRGTFVRSQRTRVRRDHSARYQWEKDRARTPETIRKETGATEFDTGLTLGDLDFRAEYDTQVASVQLAERFGIPVGIPLLRRQYWTSSRAENGVPLNLVRSYLLFDMAKDNPDLLDPTKEPWPGGTQNQLFTLGIELDRIVDETTARPPYPEEAQALDIEPGNAVLVLWKMSIDVNDRVVEVSEVIMPGDRTVLIHTTNLARWDSE